jgi:hypothetical protein
VGRFGFIPNKKAEELRGTSFIKTIRQLADIPTGLFVIFHERHLQIGALSYCSQPLISPIQSDKIR